MSALDDIFRLLIEHSTVTIRAHSKTINNAREELAEIRKHTEWQPIETAPKSRISIIGYGKRTNSWWIDICWWNGKSWCFEYNNSLAEPTHWMPIPEPPKEREG